MFSTGACRQNQAMEQRRRTRPSLTACKLQLMTQRRRAINGLLKSMKRNPHRPTESLICVSIMLFNLELLNRFECPQV